MKIKRILPLIFLFCFSAFAQSSNEEKQYAKDIEKADKLAEKIIEDYVSNMEKYKKTENYDVTNDIELSKQTIGTASNRTYYFDASLNENDPPKFQLFEMGRFRTIPPANYLEDLKAKQPGTEEDRSLHYLVKEELMALILEHPDMVQSILDIQIGDTCQLPIYTSEQWPYSGTKNGYYIRPKGTATTMAEYDQVLTYSPEGYHYINNILSKHVTVSSDGENTNGTFFKVEGLDNVMSVNGKDIYSVYDIFRQPNSRAYPSVGLDYKKDVYKKLNVTKGIELYTDPYTYEMPAVSVSKPKVINVYNNIDLLENKLEEGKVNVDVDSIYKQVKAFLDREVFLDESTGLVYELNDKPDGIEVTKVAFKATNPKILGSFCTSSASRVSISDIKAKEAANSADKIFSELNQNQGSISEMAKVSKEAKTACQGIKKCNKLLAEARRAQCTAVAAKVFEKLLEDPSNHPFVSGLLNSSGKSVGYTLNPLAQPGTPALAKLALEKDIDKYMDSPLNIFAGNSAGDNSDGTSGPEYFRCWDKEYGGDCDLSTFPGPTGVENVDKAVERVKLAYKNKKQPTSADIKLLKEIFYFPHQYVRLNLLYANDIELQEVVEKEIECHEFAYMRLVRKMGKFKTPPPNRKKRKSKGKPIMDCPSYSKNYFKKLQSGSAKRKGRKGAKRVKRACKGNPKRPICNMVRAVCRGLGICAKN